MAGRHDSGRLKQANARGKLLRFSQRSNPPDLSLRNMILAALPPEEYRRLRPYLELVPLKPWDVLWEPYKPIRFLYFPTCGMVSMVAMTREGATIEVGMTGREGFVGTPVTLGVRSGPFRAIVQIEGSAFRIESTLLQQILPEMPTLERMLQRYAYAHAMQVTQAAACNRLHHVPQRLCRWLAMSRDRTGSDLLPLTQEFLAQMLGCRRSSVTAAMGPLHHAGVIRSEHGQVRILDRKELEKRACECYGIMRKLSEPTRIG
jgi:CRP-like cAMP-binding protein